MASVDPFSELFNNLSQMALWTGRLLKGHQQACSDFSAVQDQAHGYNPLCSGRPCVSCDPWLALCQKNDKSRQARDRHQKKMQIM